jgi:hypothetical protein
VRRKVVLGANLVVLAAETAVLARRRGRLIAAKTVVRCLSGHLFTTLWIPGGSFKALRLGWWRWQRCPVGKHWSLVTPVRVAQLSDGERQLASQTRDTFIP